MSGTPPGRAGPLYTQNTQAVQGPETPGGHLALKDDFILVLFFNLASSYENMNDKFMNFFVVVVESEPSRGRDTVSRFETV